MTRREFLQALGTGIAATALSPLASVLARVTGEAAASTGLLPTRPLGKTGRRASIFGLGGEGILRTHGRLKEAVPVIEKALESGVTYFDTAPAYSSSQDYLGAVIPPFRNRIFLSSKTHERSRDGSLGLLDDSLSRLKTDHLDLWQLHDLREEGDLEEIFGRGGVLEAVELAKSDGRIKFAGITGHTDPAILLEAMRRYPFNAVLIPVNAGDRERLSFIEQVIPQAVSRGMAVIGMKITGQGRLVGEDALSMPEALGYALAQEISVGIVGCRTPEEVGENARIARTFKPMPRAELSRIEAKARPLAEEANFFKRG